METQLETVTLTVDNSGITGPLILNSGVCRVERPNINRKLTADEDRAYREFLAIMGQYNGDTITLRKVTWPVDNGSYEARLYDKYDPNNAIYVSHRPGETTYYSRSVCPKHILSLDTYTFGHKDIDWTFDAKKWGVLQLTREFHGYGNGTYYLYDVATARVRYKEDD